MSDGARWYVELHAGEKGVARLPLDLLPTPGLRFALDDESWLVTEVTVSVQEEDELPRVVMCEVELAARWSEDGQRWEPAARESPGPGDRPRGSENFVTLNSLG